MLELEEKTIPYDRLPPHSVEAEMCAVGSLMLAGDGAAFLQTSEILRPEMFYQADHGILLGIIATVFERAGKVDAMLVREELLKQQRFEEVGGIEYLTEILSSVPNAANGPHYAKIVREKWQLRQLIRHAQDMQRRSYEAHSSEEPAQDIAQDALVRIGGLLSDGKSSDAQHIGDVLQDVYTSMESGGRGLVPMGFAALDDITGGVELGEMVLVAARPSMGKSILARQIATQSAADGIPTLLFSREEGTIKMGRNILSARCDIDNHRMRKAKDLGVEEWSKINHAVGEVSRFPLWINKGAGTVQQVRALVSMMIEKHGVRLVIIDYLQRMHARGETPYHRVSAISTGLADMFHDLPVAGIVMAQLSRSVTGREDKRPQMTDLRDSGSLEQDADGIIFLHREDYYHLEDQNYQPTNIAELIIAKWRDGARNKVVKLQSVLKYQRFDDLQPHQQDDIP